MRTEIKKTFPYLTQAAVPAIFILAAFFSFYKLEEAPAVWYDEGFYHQAAENLAIHGVRGVQTAPEVFEPVAMLTVGYPVIASAALAFKLFGVGVLQARIVAAAFILAFIGAAFFLVRREFGIASALFAMLLLATFPVLYGNGKPLLGEVPALFFFVAFLFMAHRVTQSTEETKEKEEKNKRRDAIIAGILLGLCASAKLSFLVAPVSAFIAFLILRKKISLSRLYLLDSFAGFALAMLLWVVTQFGQGVPLEKIFSYYANPYEVADMTTLVRENLKRFFTEPAAIYLFGMFIAWSLACLLRFRRGVRISFSELAAFIFSLLILFSYVRTPGWYRYFFPAQMIILVYFPPALLLLSHEAAKFLPVARAQVIGTASGVLILFSLAALQAYQTVRHSFVAGYYKSERTALLQEYFSRAPAEESYLVYNAPETVVFLRSANYYQYIRPHENLSFGADSLQRMSRGEVDNVIVSKTAYEGHEGDFVPYAPKDTVAGKYLLLKKKI